METVGQGQILYRFEKGTQMEWKGIALRMYFKLYGRRCVICSKPVNPEDAHLELRDTELHLMHEQCKGLR